MTVTQCQECIAGAALANSYSEPALERVGRTRINRISPIFKYQANWRAVLDFLSMHADLPKLTITVDMKRCLWPCTEELFLMVYNSPMFHIVYDFALATINALCSLKTLGSVMVKMDAFEQLIPLLERDLLEYGGMPEFVGRLRSFQNIPPWRYMNSRLEDSNHHPEA